MSIQVRRRREAAAFLSTYVGAQGELLVDTTDNRVQVHDGMTAGGWPAAGIADLPGRNAVINGNFAVNQRSYASGTALAAGAYAHDRWKAGAGGATYTFTQAVPDTTVTLTAGSLVQAVDAPNVYAATWWLTWTGTAQARVWQGSAGGSFSSGTSTKVGGITVNALPVSGVATGTIANLEFRAGPSGGTLGMVQFEAALPNAGPTRFERRHNETLLCQRYFISTGASQVKIGTYAAAAGGTYDIGTVFFPVTMRAVPTVTLSNTIGNAQQQAVDPGFTSPFAFVLQGASASAGTLSGGGSYAASAEI